jgi:hypothetical protein
VETGRIFSGVALESTSLASVIFLATILKKPSDRYGQLRWKPPIRKRTGMTVLRNPMDPELPCVVD